MRLSRVNPSVSSIVGDLNQGRTIIYINDQEWSEFTDDRIVVYHGDNPTAYDVVGQERIEWNTAYEPTTETVNGAVVPWFFMASSTTRGEISPGITIRDKTRCGVGILMAPPVRAGLAVEYLVSLTGTVTFEDERREEDVISSSNVSVGVFLGYRSQEIREGLSEVRNPLIRRGVSQTFAQLPEVKQGVRETRSGFQSEFRFTPALSHVSDELIHLPVFVGGLIECRAKIVEDKDLLFKEITCEVNCYRAVDILPIYNPI